VRRRLVQAAVRPAGTRRVPMFSQCLQRPIETPVPGLFVCTQLCSPADAGSNVPPYAACVEGTGCFLYERQGSDCHALPDTAVGTQGASCDFGDGQADYRMCAPGFICQGQTLRCVQYCERRDGGAPCAVGTCRAFPTTRYSATSELGFCE
jgi:hypothetical protein